jgi:hypothetical protein
VLPNGPRKYSEDEGGLLCLDCLLEGKVRSATTSSVGTALCEHHATEAGAISTGTRCRLCQGKGKVHTAWTIRLGQPICIFHAIDDAFSGDDMREHDLFALVYEELRKMGHPDAF